MSDLKTGVVAHGCMVVPTAKGGLKKDSYIEYLHTDMYMYMYIHMCVCVLLTDYMLDLVRSPR